jgi:hypothetical protein
MWVNAHGGRFWVKYRFKCDRTLPLSSARAARRYEQRHTGSVPGSLWRSMWPSARQPAGATKAHRSPEFARSFSFGVYAWAVFPTTSCIYSLMM